MLQDDVPLDLIRFHGIGEGFDFVLQENMVCSMHPHYMTQDRTHALYFQETYRVGHDGGEALPGVPIKWYRGGEDSVLLEWLIAEKRPDSMTRQFGNDPVPFAADF